jgi:uncharacterized protein YjdB
MRATTLSRIVAALAVSALVGACGEDPTGPGTLDTRAVTRERMTVLPGSATITTGQVVFLKAKMTSQYGDQFEPEGVIWKSSSDAIAIVSTRGEVLGMREGRATITATILGESRSSNIRVLQGKSGKDLKPQIEEKEI